MAMNIVGLAVRSRRRRLGLSAGELAARVAGHGGRLSAAQIVAIEAGRRRVLDREVAALADGLGCKVAALLGQGR